jgi:hypothetical protein
VPLDVVVILELSLKSFKNSYFGKEFHPLSTLYDFLRCSSGIGTTNFGELHKVLTLAQGRLCHNELLVKLSRAPFRCLKKFDATNGDIQPLVTNGPVEFEK